MCKCFLPPFFIWLCNLRENIHYVMLSLSCHWPPWGGSLKHMRSFLHWHVLTLSKDTQSDGSYVLATPRRRTLRSIHSSLTGENINESKYQTAKTWQASFDSPIEGYISLHFVACKWKVDSIEPSTKYLFARRLFWKCSLINIRETLSGERFLV